MKFNELVSSYLTSSPSSKIDKQIVHFSSVSSSVPSSPSCLQCSFLCENQSVVTLLVEMTLLNNWVKFVFIWKTKQNKTIPHIHPQHFSQIRLSWINVWIQWLLTIKTLAIPKIKRFKFNIKVSLKPVTFNPQWRCYIM